MATCPPRPRGARRESRPPDRRRLLRPGSARRRARAVRPVRERQDRASAREDPAARPRLPDRQGSDLRRGGRESHRRLVLERHLAKPRPPVAEPEYEFELPDTADEAWRFTATVEIQALPEIVDWTALEVARAEVEVPQETVDAELEALRESSPSSHPPTAVARDGDTLVVDLVDSKGEASATVVELGPAAWPASSSSSARRLGRGDEAGVLRARRQDDLDGRDHGARGAGESAAASTTTWRAPRRVRHARRVAREHRGHFGSSSTPRSTRRSGLRRWTNSCVHRRCNLLFRSFAHEPPISSPASLARSSAAGSRSRRTSLRVAAAPRSSSGRWCSRRRCSLSKHSPSALESRSRTTR